MAVRTPEDVALEPRERTRLPSPRAAAVLVLAVFVGLVANGRPIGAGDTRATERVAASLVGERDFDLDEYPEVEPPFARQVGDHRVSIYPVLSSVLAAPVFAVSSLAFALDETGTALAGKWAGALLSALAAGVLFLAVGLRQPQRDAVVAALLFAFATSVWSTSQALWQHPAAVLFLAGAVLFLRLAEEDPAWAGRAGLPVAAAVAARHADVAIGAVLAVAVAVRWPRAIPRFLAWALPPVLFVLAYQWAYFGHPLQHGFTGGTSRFSEPWGLGHAGLLASPARGLLVFTPLVVIAVAGLVHAARTGERWLAVTLGVASAAHWLLMGRWSEWHGGECWGPRMMTDVLPLFFAFVADGIFLFPRAAVLLAAWSIGAQALGAFAYDYRWERLFWRGPGADRSVLWDASRSPLVFYARRGVLLLGRPVVRDGKAEVREHPVVFRGATGSRVTFAGEIPRVAGGDGRLTDVHLQRGARVVGGRALLRGRWDGVFLRVADRGRGAPMELRLAGSGQGVLYVGERTARTEPRWTTYTVAGPFRLRHPYTFATSGGDELVVTVGRGGGRAEIDWIALVPPSEPDDVYRLGPAT